MVRTLFSFRGLILVFGLVALALPIVLVAQLGVVRTLTSINAEIAQSREGSLAAAAVLQHQLDEETGVRGFAASGQRVFLEPYERARNASAAEFDRLSDALPPAAANGREGRLVRDLRALNAEWLRTVAEPIVAGAGTEGGHRLLRGKALIDRFRAEIAPLRDYFAVRNRTESERRDTAIRTTSVVSVLAIAVIVVEIVAFGMLISRMTRELDRERGFVEFLQSAASVRLVAPQHLAVGTTYRSATRGARIGGDVFDVYALDEDRTLIVIGDVSGKGLTAAVDTTFVRFALRTLASEGLAPDEIVRRFDALYRDANPSPESFVTLFAGIHDRRASTLAYVNAGHEACWVRRGPRVELLAPTGPIVGLGELAFAGASVPLGAGDLLVLATDGLTEARDPRGGFMPIEQVSAWIAGAPDRTPQALVDAVVANVTRYARSRITDDLAVLAVAPLP